MGKCHAVSLTYQRKLPFTCGMTKVKALKLFQSKRHQSLSQNSFDALLSAKKYAGKMLFPYSHSQKR